MVRPLIGLVSGTWNRLPMLQNMIQSFRDDILPGITYTITIVDGGSTDGTLEWCKSQSDIKLIEDGKLTGAISAFTRGAHATDAKYIVLSNDDITFYPGTIIRAMVHLENNLKCGALAMADNRPMGDGRGRDVYHTNSVRGIMDGKFVPLIYAQVGMFRKFLGDKCNWWMGEHEEMLGGWTYGGDNSLSAAIWRYGYSVDELPECRVEDHIANDELRQINYQKGLENDDSKYFTQQYDWSRGGIVVPSEPQLPQQDKRAARILYLPVYEPGWAVQKHPIHGKHGLRDALSRAKNKYGETHIVQEFDYLELRDNPPMLRQRFLELVDSFQPDLILTQIQAHLPITATLLAEVKQRCPASIINWNGDQAVGGLYSKELLPILKLIDLQLITNLDVVPDYEREGIKWDYWQIGYEMPEGDIEENVKSYFEEIGRGNPFDDKREYPVVYLATLRTAERNAIADVVREFGGLVEQPGDTHATLYNFSTSTLLYRRAKVIISDNGFNSRGFVSNRLFQALASGGGVVLQQHVDGLDELTGLKAQKHYIEWYTEDLHETIRDALNPNFAEQVTDIAKAGTQFVRENFSFDAQVAKLMQLIKKHLGDNEPLATSVALRYVGKNTNNFGLGNMFVSGQRYEHVIGKNLYVRREDLDMIMAMYPNDWERLETE